MAEAGGADVFELRNGSLTVKVSNWGATITSLLVPDAHGKVADVVLGFETIEPYIEGAAPYFGCIVGRFANRIKDGKFTLDGVDYSLPINNPPTLSMVKQDSYLFFIYINDDLRGARGRRGFDKVLWEVLERADAEIPSITFRYFSRDGEEEWRCLPSFLTVKNNRVPRDVVVTAKYSLPSSTALRLDMVAVPTKATPISLAQHTYWNLAGHDDMGVQYDPLGDHSIPTGVIAPVRGTPFDFTAEEKKIGSRIDLGEEKEGLRRAARVREPRSKRVLELWTDAPGMQFYTGNFLGGVVGKGGAVYGKHAGLCLETQGFPNAVNQPNFPTVVVHPGDEYRHSMLFEFSTQSSAS
ncbi:unnamed protein product [Spirodela intermedia]|uniref:Uncharacterized protein n=1 Tax=Spirodela intermedia TaxID=51605 RepID=A0A7I8JBH6_SPIIN|nr:unnamed protein product [Spirodela intermedia]CAA6667537.1 unnamed protein product [Spirodela intermedia]